MFLSVIVSTLVLTGVILLINVLIMRSRRGTNSGELQGEAYQRREDENHRLADEPPVSSAEGDARLTRQLEPEPNPNEAVTPFPTKVDQGRCPACDALITPNDEICPSCEISFVADGSQYWKPRTVGPADGIYSPPTEVSE